VANFLQVQYSKHVRQRICLKQKLEKSGDLSWKKQESRQQGLLSLSIIVWQLDCHPAVCHLCPYERLQNISGGTHENWKTVLKLLSLYNLYNKTSCSKWGTGVKVRRKMKLKKSEWPGNNICLNVAFSEGNNTRKTSCFHSRKGQSHEKNHLLKSGNFFQYFLNCMRAYKFRFLDRLLLWYFSLNFWVVSMNSPPNFEHF